MKICILTSMEKRCGVFRYAQDLQAEMARYYFVQMVADISDVLRDEATDVLLVNWHPGEVKVSVEEIRAVQEMGTRVILIFQQSFEDERSENPGLLAAVDAIAAHEPTSGRAVYIPHGIPETGDLPTVDTRLVVGTAGFVSEMKRVDVVVEAARRFDCIANMICPSHKMNAHYLPSLLSKWRSELGDRLWAGTEFLPIDDVVRGLALSTINIFWFQSTNPYEQSGQAGSVRMGLAARRPTIISTDRKFKTLFPYGDEIYVAETEEDVYRLVGEIWKSIQEGKQVKIPRRVIEDQGWSKVGEMYRNLIEKVRAQGL